jgi:cobalamin biosynthesis Mg chelatase CobN
MVYFKPAAYIISNDSPEARMTRAAVLLTAILAAASVGVFAQDSPKSASAPPQDGNQITQTQNSTAQPGARATPSDGNSAQPASAARQAKPAQGSDNSAASGAETASEDGMPARQLPQTSTILPLLGLIGLGSLVAGLFARR